MRTLEDSRSFWDAHATRDPLWAVLSDPGKEDRGWNVRRFFETGVNEIALILYELQSRGAEVTPGLALDFGCGVGRLTQALAARFERVVGVDISPKMIETATALNRLPGRVSYVCNDAPRLRGFDDGVFDFVYTNLVLQHIVPELSAGYLKELLRVLNPSGVLVFQLPSHERGPDDPAEDAVTTPMPDQAYQARLLVTKTPCEPVDADVALTLDVAVSNVSEVTWSRDQFGSMSIGNHWFDSSGTRMVVRDDGRTLLPDTLQPGGTCRLPLTITTPAEEGTYQCEVDLAHEGVRWFSDRGSAAVQFSVVVRRNSERRSVAGPNSASVTSPFRAAPLLSSVEPLAAPGDLNAADPGDFPMYGIHAEAVARLMEESAGELFLRMADRSCGRNWISYRYFVRHALLKHS